jgi:hypothetical protein
MAFRYGFPARRRRRRRRKVFIRIEGHLAG